MQFQRKVKAFVGLKDKKWEVETSPGYQRFANWQHVNSRRHVLRGKHPSVTWWQLSKMCGQEDNWEDFFRENPQPENYDKVRIVPRIFFQGTYLGEVCKVYWTMGKRHSGCVTGGWILCQTQWIAISAYGFGDVRGHDHPSGSQHRQVHRQLQVRKGLKTENLFHGYLHLFDSYCIALHAVPGLGVQHLPNTSSELAMQLYFFTGPTHSSHSIATSVQVKSSSINPWNSRYM